MKWKPKDLSNASVLLIKSC